ncbi:tetratricopeptide repeat protein [Kribbella sp. NPDC051586]|uniref:tetratricopeptide repeat protein n=1 Tax=Kribbella sp. NPDC051586 TaxID=3364118 RepID=UPI0037AEA9DD
MVPDRQIVHVESGVGYGVIGADLHVFGDGVPLYLLLSWQPGPEPDPRWLREAPSRMLNARFAVAEFTGRTEELAELRRWRDDSSRMAVRWLHGPAGQGKSRLAAQLMDESRAEGWKVVVAVHGPGAVLPPGRQEDLRLDAAEGLLLVVDYADRWPLTHLTWLFSNALLHRPDVPARVLLLARNLDSWPPVRSALADYQVDTSSQLLPPLHAESRSAMVTAARDGFATVYEIDEPDDVAVPGPLDDADFGLPLALQMAALVAVDAHAGARDRPPVDPTGLTCYLLDREYLHWTRRYDDKSHRLGPAASSYRTPPDVMNRAVFTAALTGAVPPSTGVAVLDALDLSLPSTQVLRDHAVCYPPADGTVLEPLYPDRLAEDFLAVSVPGHTAAYQAQTWANGTATAVLERTADPARAVTFLASAAARWPHLGPAQLFPLLRDRPRLAVDAGSAALSAIAAIPQVGLDVLTAIEPHFPAGSQADLDVGIADVVVRLTELRLVGAGDADSVLLQLELSARLDNAGRHGEALAAAEQAVAGSEQSADDMLLAQAVGSLVRPLYRLGRRREALAANERAVAVWRRLTGTDPQLTPALAGALTNLSISLAGEGRRDQALATAEEAVARHEGVSADQAAAVDNLGSRLADVGRYDEALSTARRAVELTEHLAAENPAQHRPDLARRLGNLHLRQLGAGRWEEAAAVAVRVVALWREMADLNPLAFEPELAKSLNHLGVCQRQLGRPGEAVLATSEAVEILRRLGTAYPHRLELAAALDHLGDQLALTDRPAEALAAGQEAVAVFRQLAVDTPARHELDLAKALDNLGIRLAALEQPDSALTACQEAVEIFERLARDNPAVVRADLARALFNLAFRYAGTGRAVDALAAGARSVELRRGLVGAGSPAYEPDLARSLFGFAVLCLRLDATGRHDAAMRAIDESITRYRRLAAGQPQVFHEAYLQAVDVRQMLRDTPRPGTRRFGRR